MKRMLPMLALLMFACVSCRMKSDRSSLAGLVGKPCTVQFRRDALGGSTSLPISPTTESFNGARVSLTGTLRSVEDQAIVLEDGKASYWIPKDSILTIVAQK